MRNILLFIGGLLLQFSVYAKNIEILNIHFKNNTIMTLQLEDQPRVSFSKGVLRVISNNVSMEFQRSDVSRFSYTDNTSSDISESTHQNRLNIKDANTLCLSRMQPGMIQLISIDGRLLLEIEVSNDGTANIPIDKYPAGVYIIKDKDFTQKFTKP